MTALNINVPVIGILRGVTQQFFPTVMDVSFQAGLQAIEVTLNTENALRIIGKSRKNVPEGKLLGAGTVCTVHEARQAIDAGAMFLVTPNLDLDVIDHATRHDIPVVAGALTPTEIYTAYKAGAAMIKVFPCQAMGGPQYIKELRGPFDSIPLAAVGGVSVDSLEQYFLAGVQAVGVSSSLFGKDALDNRDGDQVAANVKRFFEHLKRVSPQPDQ